MKSFFYRQTEAQLDETAVMAVSLLNSVFPEARSAEELSALSTEIDSLCKTAAKNIQTRLTFILPDGKVIGDSDALPYMLNNHGDRPEIRAALNGRKGIDRRMSVSTGKTMMYLAVPVYRGEEIAAVLRSSMPAELIFTKLQEMNFKISLAAVLIIIVTAVISFFFARSIAVPLSHINRATAEFAKGNLQHYLSVEKPDELKSLSESLNRMANQLKERIDTITSRKNEIQAVFSSMTEAVIVLDSSLMITNLNSSAAMLLKVPAEKLKGRSLIDVMRNSELFDFAKEAFASFTPKEKEIIIKENTELHLQVHASPLETAENGKGLVLVFNDISRQKKLEIIRKDFVANVSHELKTPITLIKGFVETLADGALDDKSSAVSFLSIIEKNVNRMNSIIDDLLSLSRLEHYDETPIEMNEHELSPILDQAVSSIEKKAADKKISLQVSCPSKLKARINPQLIEEAVINLADNAVKYSDSGSEVHIAASQDEDFTRITVSDSGRGIPEKEQERIFERFYRVDKARSTEAGGTGLGLSIVKHIAIAHGGKVAVESIPDSGSTFTIILPRF
jgi:two-component system phosphate regulon sensor histidine kinase PhoR